MSCIDKKYHDLLLDILQHGFTYEDPNRKGVKRIQIPSYQIKHDFKDGFPAITTKQLYWKGIVGELLWFLRGDTNIKYLVDNGINIWNKDAYNFHKNDGRIVTLSEDEFIPYIKKLPIIPSKIGDLGRVYGAQWRDWDDTKCGGDEIDQIFNLIKGLKETPMGTKHIVTAWNPAELDNMALPPCHWSFEILVEPYFQEECNNFTWGNCSNYINEKCLCKEDKTLPQYQFTLKWHQRSCDVFLGIPFNIASYALLAYIIGKLTNMIPKGIIGDLSNVHIYENHLDAVKEQLSRDINKYDKCELHFLDEFHYLNYKDLVGNLSIDEIIKELRIDMFILNNYNSYPSIKAEMLAYNK